MKPKVLATSWHPGGMNAIAPVIKLLQEKNLIELVVMSHNFSEKILDSHNIPYKTIQDYDITQVSVENMKQILDTEKPDLVFTGTSVQENKKDIAFEQTIIKAAKEKKMTTLAVLDFWGQYSERFGKLEPQDEFTILPDTLAIMDEYAKKDLIEREFPSDLLKITGNPFFDNIENYALNFSETDKQNIRKKIGLEQNVLLFYAANAWKQNIEKFGYWDLENIIIIDNALESVPANLKEKTGVCVKLHPRCPSEDLEEIQTYIHNSKNNIKLVSNMNSHDLILSTNITFTPSSTAAIEAIYMNKPAASIQPGLKCQDYLSILTKNDIAPVGYTVDDCKALVRRVITDSNYREHELREKASRFRTDGKATERVTALVYEMLGL
ncbi:hypothetical protein HOK51_08190 [Candidatus Woesearchaeota archaeon]|jgi:hypothetical protein|nr:hypothetical protein [Candidatus Woesearchaeota archaeon]MBT6519804.1 hypothetical protein [Candidatus Woesearchaeota archaeon]MBT7368183.1 hypothetical protein [Candidatus Woesearchaeota archaeon]